MADVFHNMTPVQIAEVKLFIMRHEQRISKILERYPDEEPVIISACGWNQFCDNLGCPGYEFS